MYSTEDTVLHGLSTMEHYKVWPLHAVQVSTWDTSSFLHTLRGHMNYYQTWYLQLTQKLHFNHSLSR